MNIYTFFNVTYVIYFPRYFYKFTMYQKSNIQRQKSHTNSKCDTVLALNFSKTKMHSDTSYLDRILQKD